MTAPTLPFVYHFPAEVDWWHDGDSLVAHRGAEPGKIIHGERIRIYGINAPELSHAGGRAAQEYAMSLAASGTWVTLTCSRQDKYGRLLAKVTLPDGTDFGDRMVAAGHAVVYLL